jgi:uncharacterized alkaline shock family protein YloU
MTELAIVFYKYVVLLLSCLIGMYVLQLVPFQDVVYLMYRIYHDMDLRIFFGARAAVLLVKNFIYVRTLAGYQQRGKTIAFDNPSGRVSVSLVALEDLIRRVIERVPEVKDVKPVITANKKGIDVWAKVILRADVNLPDMTSKLQDLVKRKIQDTIGLEETVVVRIDVVKILSDGKSKSKDKDGDHPTQAIEPNVPFHGYRA